MSNKNNISTVYIDTRLYILYPCLSCSF